MSDFGGVGFLFLGLVLVTVMTIIWPGACACLNLLLKRRFVGLLFLC